MNTDISRRRLLGATAGAMAGGATAVDTAAAHYVGLPVYTNGNLNARTGPGTGYGVIATVEQYTGGYIIDGPASANGYTWWKVQWNGDNDNDRFVGWSAQPWMDHADISYPATGAIQSGDTYYASRGSYTHNAVDINAGHGDPIFAGREGTVSYVDNYDNSDCGKYLFIDHGAGYETLYCHCSAIHVSQGQWVGRHQHIADIGTSGNAYSWDPHVHYEVNLNGAEVYVPGEVGDDVYARSGMQKNYSGLSSF